jgi:hypothetical protein
MQAKKPIQSGVIKAKPPHNQYTKSVPTKGTTDNKLVITVAAQKLI